MRIVIVCRYLVTFNIWKKPFFPLLSIDPSTFSSYFFELNKSKVAFIFQGRNKSQLKGQRMSKRTQKTMKIM